MPAPAVTPIPAPVVPAGWKVIVDDAAGYSIAFPADASKVEGEIACCGNRKTRIVEWRYLPEGVGYSVRGMWIAPLPAGEPRPAMADALAAQVTEALKSTSPKIIEDVAVNVPGWTGRDMRLDLGDLYGRLRIAFNHRDPDHLVSVFAAGQPAERANIDSFVESLRLEPQ